MDGERMRSGRRRRRIDLFAQSLGTGRPPGLVNAYGSCRIPTVEEEQIHQRGELAALGCARQFDIYKCIVAKDESVVGTWGFRCSEHLLIPVMKLVMSTKPPPYHDILAMDRTIRTFVLPKSEDNMDSPSLSTSMMCYVRSHYIELSELSRAWFLLSGN